MPTSHKKNTVATPHELLYDKKVDYRCLFLMFSVAYIKQAREQGGHHKNKWHTRSLKCIVVGTDSKSDGLLFYHPPPKQTFTCADGYRLDSFLLSGPQFEEQFDGAFTFNTRSSLDIIHWPPSFEENKTVFVTLNDNDPPTEAKILSVPIDEETESFLVQLTSTGEVHDVMAPNIQHSNPAISPTPQQDNTQNPIPLLPWIKHDAKATLFIPTSMRKPKQGIIKHDSSTDSWHFAPGRKGNQPPIQLPNFLELAQSMVTNKKLFKGWKSHNTVLTARTLRATSNIVARHVSAKGLQVEEAPSLLRHHQLHPQDKQKWDEAYDEEYGGLKNLPAFEIITEKEYKTLKKVTGPALPTMAISTLKRDENGIPKRCKYRIVVLGNLDPNNWTKTDCFAPVLSQTDVRLLTSIAVNMKRIPKSGDVSQAFVQSVLPPDEQYVLRPPPGCPTYWRLLRTLYGLKRSPRHWYEKAKSILLQLGLKQSIHSKCIFHGRIDPSLPPIYVGLYVDDFIYFSASDATEKLFESKFGAQVKTTFDGNVSHFLGINFNCIKHTDGRVSIHLSQEAFIDVLLQKSGLDGPVSATAPTPYKSGYPIDNIPTDSGSLSQTQQTKLNNTLQSYTGSLQWLATSTRPDIATATNHLSQYNHKATRKHIDSAKRIIRYLKGTKSLGIAFNSNHNPTINAFVKFPVNTTSIKPFTDANWGPQDQSKPTKNAPPLDLFKTRSLSGFIIWLNGPIHWQSKRQTITAQSSAEAEIYATDECTKYLIYLYNILTDIGMTHLMPQPTTIYNDNAACVTWSHSLTTKGLRHIQIRENAVREAVQCGFLQVKHMAGKYNISDLFTKEMKDIVHFIAIRDVLLSRPPLQAKINNIVNPLKILRPLRGLCRGVTRTWNLSQQG